jgi:hypothetical protein
MFLLTLESLFLDNLQLLTFIAWVHIHLHTKTPFPFTGLQEMQQYHGLNFFDTLTPKKISQQGLILISFLQCIVNLQTPRKC